MMSRLAAALMLLTAAVAHAEPAPGWRLPQLNGEGELALSALRGEVVLLDFWASWCVPCRASMEALQGLQREFADQPVRIVPVSVDEDADEARSFLARYGPELDSLHDPEGRVAEVYDLLGMPSSFVIGADGALLLRHEGFRDGDEKTWRAAIRAALSPSRIR